MSPLALLGKLVEIECAIGVESDEALHEMVIEAQNHVLRMEYDGETKLSESTEDPVVSEFSLVG